MRPRSSRYLRPRSELIELCSENEVAFREAIDRVGPYLDRHPSPREMDVGMMPLALGDRTNAIREAQCLLEVAESEFPAEVVVIDDRPCCIDRFEELSGFALVERRNSSMTRYTVLRGERCARHPMLPFQGRDEVPLADAMPRDFTTVDENHRNVVAIARTRCGVAVDVENLDVELEPVLAPRPLDYRKRVVTEMAIMT